MHSSNAETMAAMEDGNATHAVPRAEMPNARDAGRPDVEARGGATGFGIASLVCGAVACAVSHAGWAAAAIAGLPAMACAICATAFGALAFATSDGNAVARRLGIAGLVCGAISATALTLTLLTACISGGVPICQYDIVPGEYAGTQQDAGESGPGTLDWLMENIDKAK